MNAIEKYAESFHSLLKQMEAGDNRQYRQILSQLTDTINYLINHDFERLVQLLYAVDVSEQKLKQALKAEKNREAAPVIAELVMQRQMQKIVTRQSFKNSTGSVSDEERW